MSKIFLEEDKLKININESSYIDDIDREEDYAKNIFDSIIQKAIKEDASDIHIEPFSEVIIVRARVDGELKTILNIKIEEYPIVSRFIKLSSGMNITEKRLPQDGSIEMKINDIFIDIRISTILTIYGEKIVLRILNRQTFLKDKKELGFSNEAVKKINNIINKKSGILLITGTTGSGKTTTLYSILNDLKRANTNIMTIEDPVEYRMEGINQIQVNDKIGLTFEKGLRAILRQDPDVIIVGEIRDVETARMAIRGAITGHLVISTMHTKDALSSIERLLEMDIPQYLVSTSVIGVISQRLVKKVCNYCSHDIIIKDDLEDEVSTKVARGCDKCKDTGYLGRTVIYEIIDVDDEIKSCIQNREESSAIKNIATKNGMITFEQSLNSHLENNINLQEHILVENI